MLTRKYIRKVARLLDQTGEPRPGFLRDDKANLEGQTSAVEGAALHEVAVDKPRKAKGRKKTMINLRLEYEEDSATGDLRIVRR